MNLAAAVPDRALLIGGNTAFAVEIYKRQAALDTNNLFLSPYSLSAAMALVGAGARGITAAEIEKTMHFPFSGSRLASAWKSVLSDVNDGHGGAALVTANAVWAAKDILLRPEYLDLARERFGATIESLDFARAPEPSRMRINGWVEDVTRDKIRDLIGPGLIDTATRLVLTNAIYMKAPWATPFREAATKREAIFHAPGGDTKAAIMAHRGSFRLFRGGGLGVLVLPYQGELSMWIVLPDANDGLPTVEKALTAEQLTRWEKALVPQTVDIRLPRFQIESSFLMAPTLEAMGIRAAFAPAAADFSGMAGSEEIVISEVVHKARVDVNEAGTEAEAATAVTMLRASAMQPKNVALFHADHPFLFLIRRNDSGSILFVGRVVAP